MSVRTWHVTADVVFPNHLPVDTDDQGQPRLPQQLSPESRIPTAHRQIDGADVFVYQGDESSIPQIRDDLRFALGNVAVRRRSSAADPTTAIQEAMPIFDRVLESMSFQLQAALQIQSVRVIDLTGEPAVGEDREFGQWSGFATPTFRPTSVPMQSLLGRGVPDLNIDLDPNDTRANRALDWYLKALTAPFEADHFIFLWIACEILAADSELTVTQPYRAPCGHSIDECPECGASTAKPVQGQSLQRWLTEGFAVDRTIARRVWKARQMLHGAHAFDSKIMDELPELAQVLRAVVVAEVKRRLGVPSGEPPFAAATGLTISPHMGLSGTAKVSERDLRPLG